MSTLFGRKKARPRQSSVSGQDLNERSVPYDKLSTPARSPVAVGTFSQGLKGISAPNTNPDLTASGTELNIFTLQRTKLEREKAYDQYRDGSTTSISSADSSTLFEDSLQQTPTKANGGTQSARIRRSEASSTRSQDFGQYFPGNLSSATVRPPSGITLRSESNRNSKYAPSLTSSEPGSHQSHLSQFYHRHHNTDTFNFQRPESEEEIEAMFQNVKRTRDLDMPDLSTEQKWHIVYSDEHLRWREEKQREEQNKKQIEAGQPAAITLESPEWYIKKFLDKTITAKQATSLLVSLRSKEVRYVVCVRAMCSPDSNSPSAGSSTSSSSGELRF